MSKKRKLNVKATNKEELAKMWRTVLNDSNCSFPDKIYITCNRKGEVNWEKAGIYYIDDLIKRGNYAIHYD